MPFIQTPEESLGDKAAFRIFFSCHFPPTICVQVTITFCAVYQNPTNCPHTVSTEVRSWLKILLFVSIMSAWTSFSHLLWKFQPQVTSSQVTMSGQATQPKKYIRVSWVIKKIVWTIQGLLYPQAKCRGLLYRWPQVGLVTSHYKPMDKDTKIFTRPGQIVYHHAQSGYLWLPNALFHQ